MGLKCSEQGAGESRDAEGLFQGEKADGQACGSQSLMALEVSVGVWVGTCVWMELGGLACQGHCSPSLVSGAHS